MIAVKTTPTSAKWRLRPRERRTLLLLVDFLMAVIAMFIAIYVWSVADIYQSLSVNFIRSLPTWFFLLPFIWPFLMARLYDEHRARDPVGTLRNIAFSALIGLGLYMVFYFTSPPKSLPRISVASFIISASLSSHYSGGCCTSAYLPHLNLCAGCCLLELVIQVRSCFKLSTSINRIRILWLALSMMTLIRSER